MLQNVEKLKEGIQGSVFANNSYEALKKFIQPH